MIRCIYSHLVDGRLDLGYSQKLFQIIDGEVADANAPVLSPSRVSTILDVPKVEYR